MSLLTASDSSFPALAWETPQPMNKDELDGRDRRSGKGGASEAVQKAGGEWECHLDGSEVFSQSGLASPP